MLSPSNMKNIGYVTGLSSNFHAVFDTPQGKEVLKYLEYSCSWFTPVYVPGNPELTLINDGRRQVLSTIKSFLELSPQQIVEFCQQQEG